MKHKQKLVKVGARRFYVDENLQVIIHLLNNELGIETVCSCQEPTGFEGEALPAYINMIAPRAAMQLAALAVEHFDGLVRVTGGDREDLIQFEIIPVKGDLTAFANFLGSLGVMSTLDGKKLFFWRYEDSGFIQHMINGKPATPKQLADIEREKQKAKRNAWA